MNNSEPLEVRGSGSQARPGLIAKLALLQLLATIVLSLVFCIVFDTRVAVSALFGGLIAALTTLYMAGRLFATRNLVQAPQILVRFYSSVVLKVLFTLLMMAVCIVLIKVSIVPFIVAYLVAAVAVNWLFLLLAEA